MNLFYRGFDPNARIRSAAAHLSAAAARLALSMVRSIPILPEESWAAFQRLLTPDALWSLCLVLAGWLVGTIVGGLVGAAVNALLIAYGLAALWEQVQGVWDALKRWATVAYEAQNEEDLGVAAQHFATALSSSGITLLEVLVTHRVFRAVESKVRQRFPAPDWLRQRYQEEAQCRAARQEPKEPSRSLAETARRTAEAVASGSRYEGAKHAASAFPTAAVAVGGVALGLGTAAALAWAVNAEAQRRKARSKE